MSLSMFDLSGRRALVTGSSQGIGFALASGLAGAGASIVLNGRDSAKLGRAAQGLRDQGATVHQAAFDVTDHAACATGVVEIEAEVGPLDILINNAGMQQRAPLDEFPAKDFEHLMATNINSVFNVGQAVAQKMIPRGKGKIINICSVMTMLARPGVAPYTASKGAVANLTKGMATDWAPHGLNINGIAPGYFKTELTDALVKDAEFSGWLEKRTPAGRWGDVEELVGAAIYLASDASSFVNGHVLYVDGGMTACV